MTYTIIKKENPSSNVLYHYGYRKHGKFIKHRDDGPAVEWVNGSKFYYQHGKKHRDNDLPAVESPGGDRSWYKHGLLHRESGPAAMRYGYLYYYQNGIFHREDGPAILSLKSDKNGIPSYYCWYLHGQRHRIDGPAQDSYDYNWKLYFYKNEKANVETQEEFEKWLKYRNF
jgi:hypothetical protein